MACSTPKTSKPESAYRRVAAGRVFIHEYTPDYPDTAKRTDGGILLPEGSVLGASFQNKAGELTTTDKRTVYGVVTGCGKLASRNECRAFPDSEQGDFPLPHGTLVKLSRANDWRISPRESAYNTWDIHEHLLPGEYRDPLIWGLE